ARRVLSQIADLARRDQGPGPADGGGRLAQIHPRAAQQRAAWRTHPDSGQEMNAPANIAITAALKLPEHRSCYYGGAWHAPLSGREADTINPGTGEILGKVADAGAADVDAAVKGAKA